MNRLLIADDHPILLEGLCSLLAGSEFRVVAQCRSGAEVLAAVQRVPIDLFLLDISMPPPDGLELLGTLKSGQEPRKVVLLTSDISDAKVLEAVRLGADGIVLKESAAQQLMACLSSVSAGVRWFDAEVARRAVGEAVSQRERSEVRPLLSPREVEIVGLVARGLRNKEIARALNISDGTVRFYLHAIFEKMDVTSRVGLVNEARERGILTK